MANKMRIYGENMQDVKVVEKIMRSLTEKFNYVVCTIANLWQEYAGCHSDYAGDVEDRKSTSGYAFLINGIAGMVISVKKA